MQAFFQALQLYSWGLALIKILSKVPHLLEASKIPKVPEVSQVPKVPTIVKVSKVSKVPRVCNISKVLQVPKAKSAGVAKGLPSHHPKSYMNSWPLGRCNAYQVGHCIRAMSAYCVSWHVQYNMNDADSAH